MTIRLAPELTLTEPTMVIVPWHDDVVDRIGYDPRSTYVETFWLNVFGPTSTWIIRRMATGLDEYPGGYELDLEQTAAALGLVFSPGASNPFARSVNRCVMFGAAQPITGGLAVRRRLPPVTARHLQRMPPYLRSAHEAWQRAVPAGSEGHDVASERRRACILAEAMLQAGDPTDSIERQLLGLGVLPPTAVDVSRQFSESAPGAA
jgi:hypothetical protein